MNLIYPIENGWTIYSISKCEYCDKSKFFLERLGEELNIINVDDVMKNKYTRKEFLEHMFDLADMSIKYFPMIFKDKEYIGGYNDLIQYYSLNNYVIKNEINVNSDEF